jgi:deferrochelatase/peroxidase EfeB
MGLDHSSGEHGPLIQAQGDRWLHLRSETQNEMTHTLRAVLSRSLVALASHHLKQYCRDMRTEIVA